MGRPTLLDGAYDAVSNAIPAELPGFDAVAARRASAATHHRDPARSREDPLGLGRRAGPRERGRAGRR